MGDACGRCGGKGEVPKQPGDYSILVTCKYCAGTGRRGAREKNDEPISRGSG